MEQDPPQPPILNYQTPGDSAYLTVRIFPSEVEANMARHALEAAGIASQLQGEARHAGLGQYGAVSRGVELQVSRTDFPAARKFLDLIDQRRADRNAKKSKAAACPRCNAARIRSYHRPTLAVAAVLLLCVPIVFMTAGLPIAAILIIAAVVAVFRSFSLRICLHCRHVWKPAHEEETEDDLDDDIDDDLDDGDDVDYPDESEEDDDEEFGDDEEFAP